MEETLQVQGSLNVRGINGRELISKNFSLDELLISSLADWRLFVQVMRRAYKILVNNNAALGSCFVRNEGFRDDVIFVPNLDPPWMNG